MRGCTNLEQALKKIIAEMNLPFPEKLTIDAPKNPDHGDLAINAALLLAKAAGKTPMELAEIFCSKILADCADVISAEAARPGFCNIRFNPAFWQQEIIAAEKKGEAYGSSNAGNGEKVLVEYVSANPTGPLHVGHGRGAAVGDTIARILAKAGYDVSREYYLNDAGRQMKMLGESIWFRAKEKAGEKIDFPEDGYKGEYIKALAAEVLEKNHGLFSLPEQDAKEICKNYGIEQILNGIKKDLDTFKCSHDRYFSEKSLVEDGSVEKSFRKLEESGRSYEADGATWFDAISLGDDQNRVLRKSDGSLTYFATDIAYHKNKFDRGYSWLIDVWGADHHGYIPRLRAAVTDMGENPEKFSVLLIQLVNLLENSRAVSMSTRSGEFITLADVIENVGADAARFMFLSRSCDSPLDFDMELAKRRTLDNPVYYVQYAYARVCALMRRAEEKGIKMPEISNADTLALLNTPEDLAILRQMASFENTVTASAKSLAPHYITRYLLEIAGRLHTYYGKHSIINEDNLQLSQARLALVRAAGLVVKNGLMLLGVSAPEIM